MWLQKVPALEAQPWFRSVAVGRDMLFSLDRDKILSGDTSSCQGAPRGSPQAPEHPARACREPRLSSSASWHSCSLCVYEGASVTVLPRKRGFMNGDNVCVAPEFWEDTVQFSTLHGHTVMPLTSLNE